MIIRKVESEPVAKRAAAEVMDAVRGIGEN